MGRIKTGWWDCSSCGRKHISGPIISCPGCGKPRGADVRFYMDDSSSEVTEAREVTRAKAGADWVCPSCGRDNAAYKDSCEGCGTPRNQSTRRLRDEITNEPMGDTPHTLSKQPSSFTYEPTRYSPVRSSQRDVTSRLSNVLEAFGLTERFNLRSIGIGLGIIALILVSLFLAFQFFSVHPENYSVSSFSWERTIDINQYRTLREEDWSVPSGGRLVSSYPAIHHFVQVLDHYDWVDTPYSENECSGTKQGSCTWKDRGNGYFEEVCPQVPDCRLVTKYKREKVARYRDDPVYATKYVYDIDRWVFNNRLVSSANDQNPFWPQTAVLLPPCAATIGNLCQGQRTERYDVTFTSNRDEKNPVTHKRERISLEEWQSYQSNETVEFSVNNFGMVTSSPTRIPK